MNKEKPIPSGSTNHNSNKINVNNNFNLTISLGDSLNILALIAGVMILKRVLKKDKGVSK